jgi:CubicO group peptidase (beta-lactamase class C family)
MEMEEKADELTALQAGWMRKRGKINNLVEMRTMNRMRIWWIWLKIALLVGLGSFINLYSASSVFADQQIKTDIDRYVETYMNEHQIPGMAVGLVSRDGLLYSKGWGITGGEKENVTADTPFLLGSLSKSFTGLAVVKLMEEKKLGLDDRVKEHLPWFTLKDEKTASEITVQQLLSHMSGLSTATGLMAADQGSKDPDAIKTSVEKFSNVELTAAPGTKYQYSDANYLILGALIEEVSGQPFSRFMEQTIFSPAGMEQAGADYEAVSEIGYQPGYQSWFGIPRASRVPYDNGGAPYGYIAASANDMAEYLKVLGGQKRSGLLGEESKALFLSPLTKTDEEKQYGFGWRISQTDFMETMIWHSGSTPDSRSELFYLPESGWGGVILTNKNHIMEEAALSHLTKGIISMLNGEAPVEPPGYVPYIQFVVSAVLGMLLLVSLYLVKKAITGQEVLRKKGWRTAGLLFLVLAGAWIPLLLLAVNTPWHTIRLFAPDVAFLVILLVVFCAINAGLSLYLSFRTHARTVSS